MKLTGSTVSFETIKNNYEALQSFVLERDGNLDALGPLGSTIHQFISNYQDKRYPVEITSYGVEQAALAIGEPFLGLKLASVLRRRHDKFDGLLRNKQFSLADYFKALTRYVRLSTEIFNIELKESGELLELHLLPNSPSTLSRHQTESVAAIVHFMAQERGANLIRIGFSHAAFPCEDNSNPYHQTFGLMPDFNVESDHLVYRLHASELGVETAELSMETIACLRQMELEFAQTFDDTWRDKCHFLLQSILVFGEPKKEVLATLLAMSPRTLQRRLEAEGTNFRELLQSVRMSLVDRFLGDESYTAEELTFVLGYKDNSQVFKAIKTWHGVSLSEYRQQLLTR